ncbi:MAG: hypothetical protein J0G36_22040 [Afipia sp.]|nr:hypothetical protein [Afipia sp.]
MQDFKERIEKLREDAAECELIARLATSSVKQQAFTNLADIYREMAKNLELQIASGKGI